ncbi:hypothetical protein GCM10010472_70890 [Pseudonocardia halophobica]|uniref:Uncharacterized protein n=2 Tax=Pseudonocardia halophobica TaxID=29401 RepID=A0A9W6NWV5_9PSEU|nr:hypothetical protein GCM10017577_33950 [Pseudonocardia halophobica]
MLSFVLAGALAGVAGVLQIAAQGNADPQVGSINFILPALAAAFLGATTWRPGTYNVIGTLIALYFLSTVVNGLSLVGVAPWDGRVQRRRRPWSSISLAVGSQVLRRPRRRFDLEGPDRSRRTRH